MPTFADATRHEWSIAFTRETVDKAAELGTNVADLAALTPAEAVERLKHDLQLFAGLCWLGVEEQAVAAGIEPEWFAARLGAGRTPGRALAALLAAVGDYFPGSRLARELQKAR